MQRIFAFSMILLACAGMFLAGCESLNGPDAAVDEAATITESFEASTLDGEASILKSAGVIVDSANAFLTLRWSEESGRFQSDNTVKGHAAAVAFEKPTTLRDRNALGLDMGEVSVLNGTNQFDLPKLTNTLFGVRYGKFGGPRGPKGGMGGPRGGHGGPRDSLFAIVNIPFIGGSTYQFNITGSDKVAAMKLDIKAPAQLVQIAGLANKDTIDATQDLTITWQGDATTNTVLVLAPARKHGRFGRGQPVQPIFQRVDAGALSYTISTQTLQDLLNQSTAKAFSLHLSQSVVNEIIDATLGKILVSAGTDDQVLLTVK